MRKVYFVLMIYNEEESIASVVESIRGCDVSSFERHIVAVNDGSTDHSQDELEKAAHTISLDILTFLERRGMPESFQGLFDYLRQHLGDDDVVITMEADATNDISCVQPMVTAVAQGADIVIASRYAPGAASIGFPWYRLWGSHVINFFLHLLWGVPHAKDYSVLYRAYRGRVLRQYIDDRPQFRARKSFAVIAEILLQMSRYTTRITEVPLRYDYGLKKGKSKMKLTQTLIEYTRITPLSLLIQRPVVWIGFGVLGLCILAIAL